MDCPVCRTTTLMMAERQGIEIDYCPSCRGVWLDRGELDKLIDKAAQASTAQSIQHQAPPPRQSDHHRPHATHGHHRPKHKSLLGELFDFD